LLAVIKKYSCKGTLVNAVLKKYSWKGISKTILWSVHLGWLSDAHPATVSRPLLSRTAGENRMRKLVGQENDRKMTNQLPLGAKQTQLGEK